MSRARRAFRKRNPSPALPASGEGGPPPPACGGTEGGRPGRADEPPLTWTVRPATRQPLRSGLCIVMILVAGAGGVYWMESAGAGLLASAVLAAALLPFLLTTRYTLSPEELHVATGVYRFSRRLSAFRSFEVAGGRVWLCTLKARSVLDNYRGFLLLLADNAESVRAALVAAGLEERVAPT